MSKNASPSGIVVSAAATGDFFRDWGQAAGAVASLKAGLRSVAEGARRASRCFSDLSRSVRGVLSALMHTATVAQGLDAGMLNLYRWSQTYGKAFANTLNGLATSALYLKNSLAAMAAPLISAVSPAIDYVANKFVDLFNTVNQLFARLTGASTYVAAKRTADAWDSVGGRISKASAALKRYIAGFDELNVLSDGASRGGGGGGGGGASTMFETRQIDSALAEFVDSLKAAFDAADWQAVGTLLGEKVNALVDSVDWAGVGAQVGYCLNAAIQSAYWLLDEIDFSNFGARIGELLNHALAEMDFTALGGTVALFFASLAETLAGFLGEFDWGQFAGKAADAVNGFVTELGARLDAVDWAALSLRLTQGLNDFIAKTDWAAAGKTFAGRVNDLLAVVGTAAEGFDWAGAGKALADAVNGLFASVDWDALGDWLNRTIQGALDFGIAFVEGFDAQAFADGIGRALAKVDWDAVAAKLWELLSGAVKKLGELAGGLLFGGGANMEVGVSLLREGWATLAGWLGVDVPQSAQIGLQRSGWSTLSDFIGTAVSVLVSLGKDGWTSVSAFVGGAVSVLVSLGRDGWTSIAGFVGTAVEVLAKLKKDGWTTLAAFVGTAVTVLTKLKKDGWSSIAGFVGSAVSVATKLKKSGWSSITKFITGSSTGVVKIGLALGSVASALKTALGKLGIKLATGGVVTAGGLVRRFAAGGAILPGGRASWWDGVAKYAAGTRRAHGTVFVAGEAGPEVVGHVNGRTEILNKSQLAEAIYAAVSAGAAQAANALGAFLADRMTVCANAISATIGAVAAGVEVRAPAMASGAVLPYQAAARLEREDAALQRALDANNEDLIQTIISVVGAQTTAIVAALSALPAGGGDALTVQQVISQINRESRMFGRSPLIGA